jgi:hypothetical protein
MPANVVFNSERDTETGLYRGTITVNLPELTAVRYKADLTDFKYEMRRAISEIVEEIIERGMEI